MEGVRGKEPFERAGEEGPGPLVRGETDYLAGLECRGKTSRLMQISYHDFLRDFVKVDPQILTYFMMREGGWARGMDSVPAVYARRFPGFQGMGLPSRDPRKGEPYIHHFPDGNASVARLIVRSLIPDALPGTRYGGCCHRHPRLLPARPRGVEREGQAQQHRGPGEAPGEPSRSEDVDVTYVNGGKVYRVSGKNVVLACYNGVIPFLCPEMPEPQRKALAYGVKTPLVYTNVLIRNWTSFQKLGVERIYYPGGYHSSASLDFPVSLGSYRHPPTPDEPMLLHLVRFFVTPGRPLREQHQLGKWDLLQRSFDTFERSIRDQLGRSLSGGGFDPARDIQAITVNRWPHGYAYSYTPLTDPDLADDERPNVVGRQPFGRIHVANSDAAASAYTHAAIDEAHRAVSEIVGVKEPTNAVELLSLLAVWAAATACSPAGETSAYVVGASSSGVPFTFLDVESSAPRGIMVDIVRAVGEEAGFATEVKMLPFNALIPSLTSGRIRLIAAAMVITPARREIVDFSEPVYSYGEALVVTASDATEYQTLDELKGKVVGAQVGTVYIDALQASGLFPEVKIYDSIADILRDVSVGRIEAGFGDHPIVAYQLGLAPIPRCVVRSYEPRIVGSIGIGVRKGETELLGRINESLARLKADGTIARILASWDYEAMRSSASPRSAFIRSASSRPTLTRKIILPR